MNRSDRLLFSRFNTELDQFATSHRRLKGIRNANCKNTLIIQIIDSIRRVKFVRKLRDIDHSCNRIDPSSPSFDPIRAAAYFFSSGNIDEACWLAFLSVHFGKHRKQGWITTRHIYGGLEQSENWTWERVSRNFNDFSSWIEQNHMNVCQAFGNHRKYESIRPTSNRNLSSVVYSYINWIGSPCSHQARFDNLTESSCLNSTQIFSDLYESMNNIVSFGRTGKFDFLSLLGNLGILEIEPGLAYLKGATGPLTGARLLIDGNRSSKTSISALENSLIDLKSNITIGPMGMQVLEDSLCNWQKSPSNYIKFNG